MDERVWTDDTEDLDADINKADDKGLEVEPITTDIVVPETVGEGLGSA